VWDNPSTPASVFLTIEAARLRLVTDQHEAGLKYIDQAIKTCKTKGYSELGILAQLVRGALDFDSDNDWSTTLHRARSSPWVELSLTALAMSGRRAMNRGETNPAREAYTTLLQRADHLDHHYHRVVANEALVKL
jgi:hypothetical protein